MYFKRSLSNEGAVHFLVVHWLKESQETVGWRFAEMRFWDADKKSSRAMKITEILVAEHVVFHNLFDYIEQTAPRLKSLAEVKLLSAALEVLLRAHARTEDDLLVEPLEYCLAQIGQSETFHEEHDEIDARLVEVQKARGAKQARELLLKAVLRSREHFDKEERIVFPLAERAMNYIAPATTTPWSDAPEADVRAGNRSSRS